MQKISLKATNILKSPMPNKCYHLKSTIEVEKEKLGQAKG